MKTHTGHYATDAVEFSYILNGVAMKQNSLTGHDIPDVSGVYLLTDKVTGKTYVGSSKNIRTRAMQHFSKMNKQCIYAPYIVFSKTFLIHGPSSFSIKLLEECVFDRLLERELYWINTLHPTENTMLFCSKGIAFSEDERAKRSERTKALWANPDYRNKSVSVRMGNAYNKGYKCTPAQVENRRKAARISNMKRNYGDGWIAEYISRYPEHAGDVNGK